MTLFHDTSSNTNYILNNCSGIFWCTCIRVFFLLHHIVIHEQWRLRYSDYLILLDIEKGNPGRNKYNHFLALTVDFIVLNDV